MIFGRHYGELLPLDLCVRLADQQQQHLSYDEQQQQQQRVILEPQAPGSPHTNFDLDSKTAISKGTHGGTPGPMRNSPLTPSPSSSSSQENEDEMGYLGPSQFSIFRRQAAPVQVLHRAREAGARTPFKMLLLCMIVNSARNSHPYLIFNS